jgi:hypothetical protein
MSRILFASALVTPSFALAHVEYHDFDATGALLHSVSNADHALALIAALTLPVAAAALIWNRRK